MEVEWLKKNLPSSVDARRSLVEPKHDEFKNRNMWSLLNAFTEVLKDRQRTQPARAAEETIRLQSLLTQGVSLGIAS